jgi:O-antigen ligase
MPGIIRSFISPTIKIITVIASVVIFIMFIYGVVTKDQLDTVVAAMVTIILANLGVNEFKFALAKYKLEKGLREVR